MKQVNKEDIHGITKAFHDYTEKMRDLNIEPLTFLHLTLVLSMSLALEIMDPETLREMLAQAYKKSGKLHQILKDKQNG